MKTTKRMLLCCVLVLAAVSTLAAVRIGIRAGDPRPQLTLQDQDISAAKLEEMVAKVARIDKEQLVVIQVDAAAPCGQLLKVLSMLREKEMKQICIVSTSLNRTDLHLGFLSYTNLFDYSEGVPAAAPADAAAAPAVEPAATPEPAP